MIDSRQVTVVYQGHIDVSKLGSGDSKGADFLYNVATVRQHLPNATIILSTWDNIVLPKAYDTPAKLGIDALVLSQDVAPLPNIKFNNLPANNCNRQLVSTVAGLKKTTTKYALKLRTDSFLTSDGFMRYFADYETKIHALGHKDYSPIVACCYFTIDPDVYEHMAFHISDWTHFGETQTLLRYWDIAPIDEAMATYYERHPHRFTANFFDKQFRAKIAVEQYLTTTYAKRFHYATPTLHNELNSKILFDFEVFLARQIILLDLAQFGVDMPKYNWVKNSDFINMAVIKHADWYGRFVDYWHLSADKSLYGQYKQRKHQKLASKWVAKLTDPIAGYWWHHPKNKKIMRATEKLIKKIP